MKSLGIFTDRPDLMLALQAESIRELFLFDLLWIGKMCRQTRVVWANAFSGEVAEWLKALPC